MQREKNIIQVDAEEIADAEDDRVEMPWLGGHDDSKEGEVEDTQKRKGRDSSEKPSKRQKSSIEEKGNKDETKEGTPDQPMTDAEAQNRLDRPTVPEPSETMAEDTEVVDNRSNTKESKAVQDTTVAAESEEEKTMETEKAHAEVPSEELKNPSKSVEAENPNKESEQEKSTKDIDTSAEPEKSQDKEVIPEQSEGNPDKPVDQEV